MRALQGQSERQLNSIQEAMTELKAVSQRCAALERDLTASEHRANGLSHSKALLQKSMMDQLAVVRKFSPLSNLVSVS